MTAYETVPLDVKRFAGTVVPRERALKKIRDGNARTTRAALRLAAYRLRKGMHNAGLQPVSDMEAQMLQDVPRNTITIAVEQRCVKWHEPVPRVPRGASCVEVVVQRETP